VLQWAAAVAVLAIASSVLVEFGQGIAAEHVLRIAARAGAAEATLPKATYESVAAVIERRLATTCPQLKGQLQLTLLRNGTPVVQHFRPVGGDRLSVTISAPTSSLVSSWVRMLSPGRRESLTSAHAESQMPGRKLTPGRS
jgi:hypothetical protein